MIHPSYQELIAQLLTSRIWTRHRLSAAVTLWYLQQANVQDRSSAELNRL